MKNGTTKSGFKYTLTDRRLNNFELLDVFSEVDENPLLIPKVLTLLLGDKQKRELYEHLRDSEGTVPSELITKELKEMLGIEEVKNSSSSLE